MKNESIETKVRKSLNRKNALLERYKNFSNSELADLQEALMESASCEETITNVIDEIEDVFQLREDRSMELEEQGE
jgi:hypothetical protein